jgi:isoleucyl-tRNA synthetase
MFQEDSNKYFYYKLFSEQTTESSLKTVKQYIAPSQDNNHFLEEKIRNFWQLNNISEKIKKLTETNKKFTLASGPPFASGSPHYGHLLNIAFKYNDINNQSALGKQINMPFGYDCHGLPSESKIDQTLNEPSDTISIEKYIETGVKIVSDCITQWDTWTDKILSPYVPSKTYKTMDYDYMKSVISQFLIINNNNLISRKYMVLPFSTKFATPLSNSEATENYRNVVCDSIYIKFKLVNKLPTIPGVYPDKKNIYVLVWTTTPWTLPANMALCVNNNIEYVVLEFKNEYIICSKSLFENETFFYYEEYEYIISFHGDNLINIEYEPLYNCNPTHTYKITEDNYVYEESGTGIVHIAPAHGEDDLRICINNKIITHESIFICVNTNGTYNNKFPAYENKLVLDCCDDIINELGDIIYKVHKINHRIAYCPRSDTQLVSLVSREWFLDVSNESFKTKLHERSSQVEWFPEQNGLKHSIENSPDWCLSRDRTFGPPLPIWISDDGNEVFIPNSMSEIEEQYRLQYNEDLDSLYLHKLKKITFSSKERKGSLKLCNKVFDCWFESACMPNAINGYPFKTTQFAKSSDLVIEGKDQVTRGWFIKQLIISIALNAPIPFKKVLAHGFVLAENGQKMSKRLQNYPDPAKLEKDYGVEVILMYLKSSTAINGESMSFCEKDLKEIVRSIHIPLRNAVKLLCDNIRFYKSCYNGDINYVNIPNNIMDSWILKEILEFKSELIKNTNLYKYDLILKSTQKFVHLLTNVYIKLNRPRLSGQCAQEDFKNSLSVLKTVLYYLTVCFRTFAPYLSEEIYQKVGDIKNNESVMLTRYDMIPNSIDDLFDNNSYQLIVMFQDITAHLLRERDKYHIQLVKTLKQITIIFQDKYLVKMMQKYFTTYFKISLNVTNIEFYYEKIKPDYIVEFDFNYQKDTGRKFGRISKKLIELVKLNLDETIKNGIISYEDHTFVIGEEIKINIKLSEEWIKLCDSSYFKFKFNSILDDYAYTIGLITRKIQEFRAELGLQRWNKIRIHLTSQNIDFYEFLFKSIGDYSKLQETSIVVDHWWEDYSKYRIKHVSITDSSDEKSFRIGIEYL